MNMKKILGLAVGLAIGGYVTFAISQGKLHSADGKFLGVFQEDPSGFGMDDGAKFAVALGAAAVGGHLAGKLLHINVPIKAGV